MTPTYVKTIHGIYMSKEEITEVLYLVFKKEIILDIALCQLYKEKIRPHWNRIKQTVRRQLSEEIETMFGFHENKWNEPTWKIYELQECLIIAYNKVLSELRDRPFSLVLRKNKTLDENFIMLVNKENPIRFH